LGIVTRVTLDIQPAFEMRQDTFEGLRWTTVLSDFDAVMSAGYSVSLLTLWSGPTVTRLWIKTRLVDAAPEAAVASHLGATPAGRPWDSATPEVMQQLNPVGIPGAWFERLPHFRSDAEPRPTGHLQSEYLVPRPWRRRQSPSCASSAIASTAICGLPKSAVWQGTGCGLAPPTALTASVFIFLGRGA
jgi:xylitol oxidase